MTHSAILRLCLIRGGITYILSVVILLLPISQVNFQIPRVQSCCDQYTINNTKIATEMTLFLEGIHKYPILTCFLGQNVTSAGYMLVISDIFLAN